MRSISRILALSLTLCPAIGQAGVPIIENAEASHGNFGWRFEVTVRHGDEGWDHYADSWEILTESGKVLATRELMHPHVTEQPFTRSLSSVMIPDGTRVVYIRAKCSELGWSTKQVPVRLTR